MRIFLSSLPAKGKTKNKKKNSEPTNMALASRPEDQVTCMSSHSTQRVFADSANFLF